MRPNAVAARDLRKRLGAYLRLVRKGRRFIVTHCGGALACLEPVEEPRMGELAAKGWISRASGERLAPVRPATVPGVPLA